jgi:hypothetical protein
MLNDRSVWGNRLKELANMLPEGMCISKIDVAAEQNGKSRYGIELLVVPNEQKGFKQVDGYINSIETNKYYGKGVQIQSHTKKVMNKKEIETFQILLSSASLNKPQEGRMSIGGFITKTLGK